MAHVATAVPAGVTSAPVARTSVAAAEDVDYVGAVTRTLGIAIDAAVIDLVALVVAGIAALVASILPVSSAFKSAAAVVGAVLFVLWTIGYFTAFWTATGQTPGSRVMQIRVIRADGTALRPRHAFARLVGTMLSVPLLWGFLPMLVNARRRGVPDAMAGTVVVAAPRESPGENRGMRASRFRREEGI